MPEDHDYIGPNPVIWVERLRQVNEHSAFREDQKELIEDRLSILQRDLQKEKEK